MALNKVYFMLSAQDMDRAVRFYEEAFGMEPRFTTPEWSEMAFGDAIVALHGGGSGEPAETGLGFDVDDAGAACRAVVAAGGTVIKPPEDRGAERIFLALVQDPEGNRFSISQPVGSPAR